ncbi:MAG: copper-translocating P-type ATPase [Candidatus Bathyarchaeia archaeon]|jgi:Cu2+-exporting ATPase
MEHQKSHLQTFKRRLYFCLILTIPILLFSSTIQAWLGLSWLQIPYQNLVLLVLSTVIFVYGGLPFLQGMVRELKARQPGMMTLIGTAISVSFFYSAATVFVLVGTNFFWELATLIDVMLFGHWIEMRSVLGASRALEELVKVMPTNATVIRDNQTVEVPVSQLKGGDVVLVRPGEKIPSDGTVLEGKSAVNEALLTGESMPVQKQLSSKVIGGSVNGEGSLKVLIEKTGEDTYLSQVVKLVKQVQGSRSRTQDLANRAAALLFYTAVTVGLVTFVVWVYFFNAGIALERSVTVLVIACPHALGLAIPLVVAISTSITAKKGILIRERKAFEQVRNVNLIIFDKTGTLTEGKFSVNKIKAYVPEAELLTKTTSIEQYSEHIIAKAIVNYTKEQGIDALKVQDFKALPGKGAYGVVDGDRVYVGGPSLLQEIGLPPEEHFSHLESQGYTVVFTVINGKVAGAFALSDKIRPESKEAIAKLHQQGVKVYMLTGDSQKVAQAVAEELGIDAYFAQVLPDQKADRIKELQANGFRVAMVGDGINDAPALVTADVGIAIGAGTDVAIESADIILVKNDPKAVLKLQEFSKKTYSKMVQNLWWAAGYNIMAIPLAAGVLYGYGVLLPPALGALFMSLSTVIVAVNSQTLRKYDTSPKSLQTENQHHDMKDMDMHMGHSM